MKVKKGDTILVISGKDRGRTGKILRSFPKEQRILVDSINMKQKRMKPRRQGEQGQMVKLPSPMAVSSVKFLCPKCGKAVRLGYEVKENKKFRICKKCKSQV